MTRRPRIVGHTLVIGAHVTIYVEPRDLWVGYFRGPRHHYVCLLPTVVIRWPR